MEVFFKKTENHVFLREPVEKLFKQLREQDGKIILSGMAGCGKTTVLKYSSEQSVSSHNPIIYYNFSQKLRLFPNKKNIINNDFFNIYFDTYISLELLNYIKKYYPFTFDNSYKDLEDEIKNTYNSINAYIVDAFTGQKQTYLENNNFIVDVINKIKKDLSINSLSLAIDNFDYDSKYSNILQKSISDFFNHFTSIILGCGDKSLKENQNRNNLQNNGFSFFDIDYGKNVDYIKYIIGKIQLNISDETYAKICEMAKGNIKRIIFYIDLIMKYPNNGENPLDLLNYYIESNDFCPNENFQKKYNFYL